MLTRFLAGFGQKFRAHPVRGLLLLVAAVGLIHAARTLASSRREVVLVYEGVPRGDFEVELRDAEGVVVRRTRFGPSADRAHPIELGDGRYEVHLRTADGQARRQAVQVVGDGAIEVRWRSIAASR